MKSNKELLAEALKVHSQLEKAKGLYKKLDAITLQLKRGGFKKGSLDSFEVSLVDNFKGKNTAFKAAAVRRFELEFKPRGKK